MAILKIDTREKNKKLFEAFDTLLAQEDTEIICIRECLECGDIIYGNVCIERKEANDFVNSIMDGRMTEQTAKMNLNFKDGYKYIIIEGNPYETVSQISNNSIIGKMTSLLVKHDIRLMFVSNTFEFVYACISLINKHIEQSQFKPEEYKKLTYKTTDEDIVTAMIHQIPGVGYEKAIAISNMYNHSFTTFIKHLRKEDLLRIDGIGDKTAEKIMKIIQS